MSILDFKTTRQEWLEEIEARSYNSMQAHKFGIQKWDEFLTSIGHNDEVALKELKAKSNEPDAYLFLNKYVVFQTKQGLKRTNITLNFQILRSWCSSNGIMLHQEYIRSFVKFPKLTRELKVPLNNEIIKSLIVNSPKNTRIILMVLLSSGMRIGEVLQLKVRDINPNTSPIQIKVRASTTKTKEERIAYVSSECWEQLRPLLNKDSEDFIFLKKFGKHSLIYFEGQFGKVRKQCGWLDKYEDGKYYHVNIHAFRANYMTQATKILGGDTAHALLGHHQYLDQYFRLSEKERGELYQKLEPYLTVSDEARQRVIIDEKDKQIVELQKMKIRIEKLEAEKRRKQDLD